MTGPALSMAEQPVLSKAVIQSPKAGGRLPASKRHFICLSGRTALLSVHYFFFAPRRAIAAFISSMKARLEALPNMSLRFFTDRLQLASSHVCTQEHD